MRRLAVFALLLASASWSQMPGIFFASNNASGLVGWWKLCGDASVGGNCSASTSTTVADSSYYGNAGTWSGTSGGTTGYYAAGNVGPWSGYFNPTLSNYVVAGSTNTALAGSFSMSAWVNFANVGGAYREMIVTRNDASNSAPNAYFWYGDSASSLYAGRLVCGFRNAANSAYLDHAALWSPTAGTWYYVACVLDSTAKTISMYVNGVLLSSQSESNLPYAAGTQSVYIGGHPGGTTVHFNGAINDVRIYGRSLSAQEIAAMYKVHN